ncbi:zinc ribbon domain-containing protein [Delftia tsuruhatensis]|uniref:FmdB family zinc ribbon protein n=2 Tax=Pseudomonadota TaxID=1224 RepID=UPI001054FA2E|nr:FmdB family zinc ribbon protein [Delftia tsuruhatensis]TDF34208.1 zinc ribbon domain-containing protein [Delftia tsuruhatensis]
MPIYAYKCGSCGHAKDVLRKISDAPLTTCPACGAETFSKQLTAAGFQLKGSGWYATDFKNSGGKSAAAPAPAADAPASDTSAAPAATASAPAAAPASASTPATAH